MPIDKKFPIVTGLLVAAFVLHACNSAKNPSTGPQAASVDTASNVSPQEESADTVPDVAPQTETGPLSNINVSLIQMNDILPTSFDSCEVSFRLKNGSDQLLAMVSVNFIAVDQNNKPVAEGMVLTTNFRGNGSTVVTTPLNGTTCADIAKFTDLKVDAVRDNDKIDSQPQIGGDSILPLVSG